jgi:hypothetical protein
VAGAAVSLLAVAFFVFLPSSDASTQDKVVGAVGLTVIVAGSLFCVWLGMTLMTRVPYGIMFNANAITRRFPFRTEVVPRNAIQSCRYLFVLGGRFGGPGDAVVARLHYRPSTSERMHSCFLFLVGEGPAPAVLSTKHFVTDLDRFEPSKRRRI